MVAVAAAGLAGLPGCSLDENGVLVVGHDEQGTLVAGAITCDGTGWSEPMDNLVVHDGRAADLWAVGLPHTGPEPRATEPPPPPDDPRPSRIDEVTMVAVGDPDPPFGSLGTPLEDPLPSRPLTVEAYGTDPWDPYVDQITVGAEGEPDTYQVAPGEQGVIGGLDAAGAAEAVADVCEDRSGDVVTAALVTGLVATGVVGVLFGIAAVVAARQYRRAGAAAGRSGPG